MRFLHPGDGSFEVVLRRSFSDSEVGMRFECF
jgi:hypothetical protein